MVGNPVRRIVGNLLQQSLWQRGPLLAGLGLLLIVSFQFWEAAPLATAIALIGRGVVLSIEARPRSSRQETLVVLNLSVYGLLTCLAIAAQSQGVLKIAAAPIRFSMLLDHSLAIVVLLGLMVHVGSRLSQVTTELDR
jgi:hypothetical protein